MGKLNWKELDSMINFNANTPAQEIAKNSKVEYVSEFVHNLYFSKKIPVSQVAIKIGSSEQGLRYWMRKWGFELRPRKNVTFSTEKNNQILSLKKTHSLRETAKECGCSVTSVRRLWGPVRQKKIKIPADPKPESVRDAGYNLSTYRSRGVSKEKARTDNLMLERMAKQAHRGDKRIPLPERTMRIGEYVDL